MFNNVGSALSLVNPTVRSRTVGTAHHTMSTYISHNKTLGAFTLLVGWQEEHLACKKTKWWGAGLVICLEQGADLHIAQLMPLTRRSVLPFWFRLTLVVPKRAAITAVALAVTRQSKQNQKTSALAKCISLYTVPSHDTNVYIFTDKTE